MRSRRYLWKCEKPDRMKVQGQSSHTDEGDTLTLQDMSRPVKRIAQSKTAPPKFRLAPPSPSKHDPADLFSSSDEDSQPKRKRKCRPLSEVLELAPSRTLLPEIQTQAFDHNNLGETGHRRSKVLELALSRTLLPEIKTQAFDHNNLGETGHRRSKVSVPSASFVVNDVSSHEDHNSLADTGHRKSRVSVPRPSPVEDEVPSHEENSQQSPSSEFLPVSTLAFHSCENAQNCQRGCIAKAVAPSLDHMSEEELVYWHKKVTGREFVKRDEEKFRGRIRRIIRTEVKKFNTCCDLGVAPKTPSPGKLVVKLPVRDSPLREAKVYRRRKVLAAKPATELGCLSVKGDLISPASHELVENVGLDEPARGRENAAEENPSEAKCEAVSAVLSIVACEAMDVDGGEDSANNSSRLGMLSVNEISSTESKDDLVDEVSAATGSESSSADRGSTFPGLKLLSVNDIPATENENGLLREVSATDVARRLTSPSVHPEWTLLVSAEMVEIRKEESAAEDASAIVCEYGDDELRTLASPKMVHDGMDVTAVQDVTGLGCLSVNDESNATAIEDPGKEDSSAEVAIRLACNFVNDGSTTWIVGIADPVSEDVSGFEIQSEKDDSNSPAIADKDEHREADSSAQATCRLATQCWNEDVYAENDVNLSNWQRLNGSPTADGLVARTSLSQQPDGWPGEEEMIESLVEDVNDELPRRPSTSENSNEQIGGIVDELNSSGETGSSEISEPEGFVDFTATFQEGPLCLNREGEEKIEDPLKDGDVEKDAELVKCFGSEHWAVSSNRSESNEPISVETDMESDSPKSVSEENKTSVEPGLKPSSSSTLCETEGKELEMNNSECFLGFPKLLENVCDPNYKVLSFEEYVAVHEQDDVAEFDSQQEFQGAATQEMGGDKALREGQSSEGQEGVDLEIQEVVAVESPEEETTDQSQECASEIWQDSSNGVSNVRFCADQVAKDVSLSTLNEDMAFLQGPVGENEAEEDIWEESSPVLELSDGRCDFTYEGMPEVVDSQVNPESADDDMREESSIQETAETAADESLRKASSNHVVSRDAFTLDDMEDEVSSPQEVDNVKHQVLENAPNDELTAEGATASLRHAKVLSTVLTQESEGNQVLSKESGSHPHPPRISSRHAKLIPAQHMLESCSNKGLHEGLYAEAYGWMRSSVKFPEGIPGIEGINLYPTTEQDFSHHDPFRPDRPVTRSSKCEKTKRENFDGSHSPLPPTSSYPTDSEYDNSDHSKSGSRQENRQDGGKFLEQNNGPGNNHNSKFKSRPEKLQDGAKFLKQNDDAGDIHDSHFDSRHEESQDAGQFSEPKDSPSFEEDHSGCARCRKRKTFNSERSSERVKRLALDFNAVLTVEQGTQTDRLQNSWSQDYDPIPNQTGEAEEEPTAERWQPLAFPGCSSDSIPLHITGGFSDEMAFLDSPHQLAKDGFESLPLGGQSAASIFDSDVSPFCQSGALEPSVSDSGAQQLTSKFHPAIGANDKSGMHSSGNEPKDDEEIASRPSKLPRRRKTMSPLSQLELLQASSSDLPLSNESMCQRIPPFRLRLTSDGFRRCGGVREKDNKSNSYNYLDASSVSSPLREVPWNLSDEDTEDSFGRREFGSVSSAGEEPKGKLSLAMAPTSLSPTFALQNLDQSLSIQEECVSGEEPLRKLHLSFSPSSSPLPETKDSNQILSSQEMHVSPSTSTPPFKGILKTGQVCKGLCYCAECAASRTTGGTVSSFIGSQMKCFQTIAEHLTKDRQNLRALLEANISSPSEPEKIQVFLKRSKEVDRVSDKRLALLLKDCKRYCKLTAKRRLPSQRKIIFADEVGKDLCHIKTFQSNSLPTD